MSNEFPKIEVNYFKGNPSKINELFKVSIPIINELIEKANISFSNLFLNSNSDKALREQADIISPAISLLAVAVSLCDTCPVKIRNVCSGMKNVYLADSKYNAVLEVLGADDRSSNTATEQLAGAVCNITASDLNNIHPVKQ